MTAALEGLRILDMTQYEAGTSSTQMLAWMGADVVKIESKQGDPARRSFATSDADSQYYMNYNANKRAIVLDLKSAKGRDVFLSLVPRFDVFVENFGPGVMESLDLDYEVLKAKNPAIIYTRIKGYGLDGPYSQYKCFDPLAQAAAGAFSVTGEGDGPPVKPGPTMADTGTGMQAALAITAAWAKKLRTGEGEFIEISMQEVMTMFMRTTGVMQWGKTPAQRRGHRGGAPTGMYRCKGGGSNDYVHMLISNTRMWDQLCVAMERDDLLVDERFQSARGRQSHADELDAEITSWTMQHEKFEAMHILCRQGVAASAVFDTMEVFHDEHLRARNFFHEVEHPEAGTVTLMGSPIRMASSPVVMRTPPLLGQDTAEVLSSELGLSAREIEELAGDGAIGTVMTAAAGAE